MQVLRIVWFTSLVTLSVSATQDMTTNTKSPTVPDTKSQTVPDTTNTNTNRTRRSDVLGLFNSKFHKKFALLGSLSSSNPHIPETGPDYGPPITYDHKAFSLWSFKKAIFSTLLQAIKAITGGVIALKGQIIKVKGHLIAAKGHLLQTKGEAITDFGRHIATKALLTPVHVPPSATGVSSYGHTATATGVGGTGYAASKPLYGLPLPSAVSAPSSGYGSPSAPSSSYGAPPAKAPPSSYGPPPANVPPSSYGPPPAKVPASSYGGPAASAPSNSYGAPASPQSSPPVSSYGAPPPPVPSTSYGTPVGSAPASSGDYTGPPPPSSLGVSGPSNNLFLPPSFPSGPAGFTAPATAYGSPLKRDIKLPNGVHAGLLVLKPAKVPVASLSALDPRHNLSPRVRKSPQPFRPLPAAHLL